MDYPYYVERVTFAISRSVVSEWNVVRGSREVVCSTPDVTAAYRIVDLLNEDHKRKGLGADRALSLSPSAARQPAEPAG